MTISIHHVLRNGDNSINWWTTPPESPDFRTCGMSWKSTCNVKSSPPPRRSSWEESCSFGPQWQRKSAGNTFVTCTRSFLTLLSSMAQQLATKLLFLHVLINSCNCSCLGNKCYYGFDNNNQSVKSVNSVSDCSWYNTAYNIICKYSWRLSGALG